MPHVKSETVYYFDELSDKAKGKARDWYREGALDHEWWDSTYEDAKQCFSFLGYDTKDMYFSGFSSQGDGACFAGHWSAKDVSAEKLKEHAPKDTELHRIADALSEIAKKYPDATCGIEHKGHYYHKYCTDFSVELGENLDPCEADEHAAIDSITELSRDSMQWLYKRLEAEHDWLLADAQVDEAIKMNEYEFYENGSRA